MHETGVLSLNESSYSVPISYEIPLYDERRYSHKQRVSRIILHGSANLFLTWVPQGRNFREVKYIKSWLYFIKISHFLVRVLHEMGHTFSYLPNWITWVTESVMVSSWLPTWACGGFQENILGMILRPHSSPCSVSYLDPAWRNGGYVWFNPFL